MKKIITVLIFVLSNMVVFAQTDSLWEKKVRLDSLFNACSHLSFQKNGDTCSTAFCAFYKGIKYSFQTNYYRNAPSHLMIYIKVENPFIEDQKLVAELHYRNGKWKRDDYHCTSVDYWRKLLRVYLKNRYSIHYQQVEYYEDI